MAYKYNGKVIRAGRAWSDDNGIQHPRNWMIWSEEEKTNRGLVWEDDPIEVTFDNRFYWSANNPKALDDIVNIDEQTSVTVTDNLGNVQYTYGLKTQWKKQTNETANSLLSLTDWHIIKATETDYNVPSKITSYRVAVRKTSNDINDAIDSCTSITEFIALFETPTTVTDGIEMSDGNPFIYNWPILEE